MSAMKSRMKKLRFQDETASKAAQILVKKFYDINDDKSAAKEKDSKKRQMMNDLHVSR